jgi:hypothetical protein
MILGNSPLKGCCYANHNAPSAPDFFVGMRARAVLRFRLGADHRTSPMDMDGRQQYRR